MVERLVGTVLTLPGATAAELLADPFDVVWVDLEHGALGPLEAQEVLLGAQGTGSRALVRVSVEQRALAAAMLDAGADGVVVADVRDGATAAAVVSAMSHPPRGTRGWGPRRSALHRRHSRRERPAPSLWVQIESAEGVENAAEIAAIGGVDVLAIGTADLSFALGVSLDGEAPALLAAVERVRRAAADAGVALCVAGALDAVAPALLSGASILVHSTDARLCAGAVDGAAEWLRSAFDPEAA